MRSGVIDRDTKILYNVIIGLEILFIDRFLNTQNTSEKKYCTQLPLYFNDKKKTRLILICCPANCKRDGDINIKRCLYC